MSVRSSQEILEVVLQPSPSARSTQETLEVVLLSGTVGDTRATASQSGTAEAVQTATGNGDTQSSAGQSGTALAVETASGSGDTEASAEQAGTASAASIPSGPSVRISQEVLETVLQPSPAVRSSQETLEVIVASGTTGDTEASAEQSGTASAGTTPDTGAFTVRCDPRVRWSAFVPVNEFAVRTSPRVEWIVSAGPTGNVFVVHTAPQVHWNTGPGTASTKCISADGVVPPPDGTTESTEENYVF